MTKQIGRQIHVALPPSLRERLTQAAEEEERSIAFLVRKAIENYLDAIHGGAEDEPPYTPEERKALGLKEGGDKKK